MPAKISSSSSLKDNKEREFRRFNNVLLNDCSKFINANGSVLEDCRSAYISKTPSEQFITYRVSCRQREMYMSLASVCLSVSVCLPLVSLPHYCTELGVTLRMVEGAPPSCALLGGLQSVPGFRCYDNIVRTRNVSECLYSLYAYCRLKARSHRRE